MHFDYENAQYIFGTKKLLKKELYDYFTLKINFRTMIK